MRAYEYRHVVGFEETNLIGNVYYANHVRWQGRCREMFLRDRAPEVIEALKYGLVLVTTRVSCEFMAELVAFDEIILRMRLGELAQNRITMKFEYWRGPELVARGEVHGRIVDEPSGGGGFGYDPYFFADELGRTFGEATREAKERVSHRGRAFRALLAAL